MFFCNQPWEQFHVHIGGGVWFCCMRPSKTQRVNYNEIEKTDFREIINNDEVVKLRDSFAKGIVPAFCKGCMMLHDFESFEDFAEKYDLQCYCKVDTEGNVDYTQLRSLKESYFELTTHCNFKCAYCLHSTLAFSERIDSISGDVFFAIVDRMVKELQLEKISMTGIGEFTLHPQWRQIIDKLKDCYPEIEFHMFSNFGRHLKPEELETLQKIDRLNVSIDTQDADLFKRLRSGDFNTVIDNLRRFRQSASHEGKRTAVCVAAVVCDKNLLKLEKLVDFLHEENLCDEITLTPMTLLAPVANMLDIFPISTKFKTPEESEIVRNVLATLYEKCKQYQIELSWSGDLQNYYRV